MRRRLAGAGKLEGSRVGSRLAPRFDDLDLAAKPSEPRRTANGNGVSMSDLSFEKRDGVALLTLNRPAKKNALTLR